MFSVTEKKFYFQWHFKYHKNVHFFFANQWLSLRPKNYIFLTWQRTICNCKHIECAFIYIIIIIFLFFFFVVLKMCISWWLQMLRLRFVGWHWFCISYERMNRYHIGYTDGVVILNNFLSRSELYMIISP